MYTHVCMSEDAKATASRFYYCYLSVRYNLGATRPRRIKFRLAPHSQGQSHSVLSLSYPFKPASPERSGSHRAWQLDAKYTCINIGRYEL